MPYAKPPLSPESHPLDLPPLKLRPKHHHRRTRSANPTFAEERSSTAFTSLTNLPRHKAHSSERKTLFHIDDHDSDSSDTTPPPEPQSLNALRLSVDTKNVPPNTLLAPSIKKDEETSTLPFPLRGSPLPSPQPPSPTSSPLPRTPSTPIILSNGKPLKPSLKSSHSSPHVPGLRMHLRAQSEPSTPSNGPVTPKNVHFAGDDTLRSVRVFNSSGKPVNVSRTNAEETETETEYDSSNAAAIDRSGYPFPRTASPPQDMGFELDSNTTSAIPTANPRMYANVHMETLVLPRSSPPVLRGSVVVRNIAFAKEVAVRFTLDDWQTTSEVLCKHVISLPSLPPPFPHPHTEGDRAVPVTPWDRFSFIINLEDFERKLHEKTMWFVVRYTCPGVGEWWDNNNGKNYRVGFRNPIGAATKMTDATRSSPIMGNSQQRTFSAPPTLKGTPTTGAIQAVAHATKSQAPPPKITLPSPQNRAHHASMPARPSPPIRHNSSPQPMTLSSMGNNRSVAKSLYASVPMKLNLMNYAAPSVPSVSTPVAPRQSSPTREFVGLSDAAPMSGNTTPPTSTSQSMEIFGGMPATAPRYDFPWPVSNNSSSQSLSDGTPPPLYSALPAPSEHEKQRAKDIVSSPTSSLANDLTYAAFLKQWCFVQSPTPSPSLTPPTSVGSSAGGSAHSSAVGALGLGDALSGLYGGAGMRSDSPMLAGL
ncbi:uncharacterized protein FOMMEDRAFT_27679 [Fomitiporia mediterranea MF3/22]|uniref:uncharacterized protein n=1 Tax=Fomitiporia mediterranea (strain MF3/22) TaxID=694068 RepID=UPI0004408814|nr:uncharacterized protein FOMMEDRAFT_27679 [Fomitiporia mediterranea MF3/22]EJD03811.1 hypothetical protein FOMMEDRAFT_27679 [Fomitiporia mediterranea MF3/22]